MVICFSLKPPLRCPIVVLFAVVCIVVGTASLVIVTAITLSEVGKWWTVVMQQYAGAAVLKAESKFQRYFGLVRHGGMIMQAGSTILYKVAAADIEMVDTIFGALAMSLSAYSIFATSSSFETIHFPNSSCTSIVPLQPITMVVGPSMEVVARTAPHVAGLFGPLQCTCTPIQSATDNTSWTSCTSVTPDTVGSGYYSSWKRWTRQTWSFAPAPLPFATSPLVATGGPAQVRTVYQDPLCGALVTRTIVGVVAVVDFGLGAASFLQDLRFTPNSRFAIFEAATGAIFATSHPLDIKANVSFDSNATLVELSESHDDVIRAVVGVVGMDALRACTVGICSWDIADEGTARGQLTSAKFFGSSNGVRFLRVAAIRDAWGLDMRVAVIIPAADFTSQFRDAVIKILSIGFGSLMALVALSSVVAHVALRPLRDAAESLSTALHGALVARQALSMQQFLELPSSRRWCNVDIAEIKGLLRACRRVWTDLSVLMTFMPMSEQHEDSSIDGCAIDEAFPHLPHAHESIIASEGWMLPVTFVALNMSSTHRMRKRLLPSELAAMHATYLTLVMDAAAKHGGVVGSFYGDHVFVHFNAQHRVRRHAAAACYMMVDVSRSVRSTPGLPPVAMAAATGPAVAQTMGSSSSIRGFHIVGRCVGDALRMAYCASIMIERDSYKRVYHSVPLVCQRTENLVQAGQPPHATSSQPVKLLFMNRLVVDADTSVSGFVEIVSELLFVDKDSFPAKTTGNMLASSPDSNHLMIEYAECIRNSNLAFQKTCLQSAADVCDL